MSATLVFTRGAVGGGSTISKDQTITSGQLIVVSEAIPGSSTDLEVAFAFVNAKLKAIYILADQAMTIETNSGSAADDTATLIANQPYQWGLGSSYIGSDASPFSADVTSIFVTNTTAGTLTIIALVDPT